MPHHAKVRQINRKELDRYFDQPFNPPEEDDQAFNEEYWEVHGLIKAAFESLGGVCDPISGDFVLNEGHGRSRWIAVDLNNETLTCKGFIPVLMKVLNKMKKGYAIYVTHGCPEDTIFHLIISRDEIVYSPSESVWLKRLLQNI